MGQSTIAPTSQSAGLSKIETGSALVTEWGRRFCLGREIASGGEATIYEIAGEREVVCKIYHSDSPDDSRADKLRAMAAMRPDCRNACWPLALVNDGVGRLRGFAMQKAEGVPLSFAIMDPAEFMRRNPDWTRRDSVRLALNILEGFSSLHRNGVLVGDVSDQNILMRSDADASFVDCDSYQIKDFACAVGTDAYTPPELQGVGFRNRKRRLENEVFSIAVLLFKIMVPGKHPFSHQNGASLAENICKGLFPYRIAGAQNSTCLPVGPWRFCWSHLPICMKQAFGRAFMSKEPMERPSVAEWIHLFRRHDDELRNPGKVFTGESRQIGFDLSILPKNYAYWKAEQIRNLPKTDYELHMEKASGWISGPNHSNASSKGYGANFRSRSPAAPANSTSSPGFWEQLFKIGF